MAMTLARPNGGHGAGAGRPGARLRVTVWLRGQDCLQVWDDRVVAPDETYALDDYFGAEVAPDPRAPLTVDPPMGISLLSRTGRWNTYFPANEADSWEVLFAIREACQACGVEPVGMTDKPARAPVRTAPPVPAFQTESAWRTPMPSAPFRAAPEPSFPLPQTWRPSPRITRPLPAVTAPIATPRWASEQPVQYAPPTPAGGFAVSPAIHADAPGTSSDELLAALAHLSLVFLPVVLPVAVWLTLRPSAPRVAQHARQAAVFQSGIYMLGLALLAYAFANVTAYGSTSVAALIGLLGFIVLLAAATVCAFYAAMQALHGYRFRYLDLLPAFR
jgi:uncharacterized Tic20 family protein